MSEVPREAVEFARTLVRAFYPAEYVILLDAVLRKNNYVSHGELAHTLRMQPKDMRQILVRMVTARIMRSEKRQQKKINREDGRFRMVNTEFWFVPLTEMIDAFTYRVHVMSSEIERRRNNELAAQKYICASCKTEYQLVEIVAWPVRGGLFVCEKMGVREDRRPLPCRGLIKEQDNSQQIREFERLQKLIDDELRPLRERAAYCATLDIPAHPLDGADEKTWGERVPETIGMNGEKVDEEGLTDQMKSDVDGVKRVQMAIVEPEMKKDPTDDFIPEKPSWFKDSRDEDDDAWDADENHNLDNKTGTAASFGKEEDEKAYYERYLKEIGGASASEVQVVEEKQKPDVVEVVDVDGGNKKVEAKQDDATDMEDPTVSVAGRKMKLSEVSAEMEEQMSAEEYKAYYALAQGGGGGGDDEDDEFD